MTKLDYEFAESGGEILKPVRADRNGPDVYTYVKVQEANKNLSLGE